MEKLKKQVQRARGRLNLQQFLSIVAWSLFAWLLVAAVALAVPKIWAFGWEASTAQTFAWSVIGGGFALALITAGVWTWLVRRGELEAAIEIDRRFGLKERISSTLTLAPQELESEAGRALLEDALRRVERIDVGDKFNIAFNWRTLLPLVPAVLVFVLVAFVPDAKSGQQAAVAARNVEIRKAVKTSTENLKKKIAERRKKAEETGLKDAEAMFKKLEQGLDGMHDKTKPDRKDTLVKLNNLAKQLKDRAQKLRDSDEIKKQMNALKDLKQGPAEKMAKALKDGEFGKALEEMKKLQDKLKEGELNEKEQEQLKQQMQQMQEKLQELADAQQQAKDELKKQIEEAKKQGNLDQAGKMQDKLDKLQQQQKNMDKLQQMADKMGQAAEALEQGNQQAAAEQMQQLAQDLEQMEDMKEELEMIEGALDQIADAKQAMNCPQCEGDGCQQCMGDKFGQAGNGKNKNGPPGRGLGEGQGRGDRPEEEHQTGGFDSRVRQKMNAGEVAVVGETDGPNRAGVAREEIKNAIREVQDGDASPLTEKRLPRSQRQHTKEYFDAFRKGE